MAETDLPKLYEIWSINPGNRIATVTEYDLGEFWLELVTLGWERENIAIVELDD